MIGSESIFSLTSLRFVVVLSILSLLSKAVSVVLRTNGYLRLIVIGDSVDRYMVQDWCSFVEGHIHTEISRARTNHTGDSNVIDLFYPYRSRHRSWEIRICENYKGKVYVSMIANKFGVKNYPPWHMPLRTMSGLESILSTQTFTLSELFNIGMAPAAVPINRATGGEPHGVLLNSAFWDLSHPDKDNIRTEANKENWLNSWERNVTDLMQIIKRTFPNTTYFAWHTGNNFATVPEGAHWNTRFALDLLHKMNAASEDIAKRNGYDWIDFARHYKVVRRDVLHPTAPSLIKLCNDVIYRLNNSVYT